MPGRSEEGHREEVCRPTGADNVTVVVDSSSLISERESKSVDQATLCID